MTTLTLLTCLLLAAPELPVAAPVPRPIVHVYVLIDSSEKSAGLRHELQWAADPYSPRHRAVDLSGVTFTVIEWNSVPSFKVPGIPCWRTRYSEWRALKSSCGCGCTLQEITSALERDDGDYERWNREHGSGWFWGGNEWTASPSFEEWKERR